MTVLVVSDARTGSEIAEARALFQDYAARLGVDLCFQDFDRELRELPGEYAPPGGALLLARMGEEIAGCVALRRLSDNTCEMKRLFVRDPFRGKGIGKSLAGTSIERARQIGYRAMRLDTLPFMTEAIALYGSLGFREIRSYRFNPVEGALYFELDLHRE